MRQWDPTTQRRGPCPSSRSKPRARAEGIEGIQSAGGNSRREAVAEVAKSVGGELESFYFAFGGAQTRRAGRQRGRSSNGEDGGASYTGGDRRGREALSRPQAAGGPTGEDEHGLGGVRSLARERPPGRSAVGDGTFRTRLGGRRCQQRGQRAAVEIHLVPLDEVSIEDHKVEPGNLDRAALARRGQRP